VGSGNVSLSGKGADRRLIDQHHRNPISDRIALPTRCARQAFSIAFTLVNDWLLVVWARQDFQQRRVETLPGGEPTRAMRVWNRAIWAVIRSIEDSPGGYNRADCRKTRCGAKPSHSHTAILLITSTDYLTCGWGRV
jgi:hypothetical protein